MSQENVALVASVYDADRDYTTLNDPSGTEAVLEGRRDLYAPQFEFHVVIEGNRLVQRGIDGYLKLTRDWLEPWESYNIAPDGIREIDERIAVLTRHRGRLKGRGSEVVSEGVDVWTVREGLLLRLEAYLDRERGFEALGLRE